MIRLAVVDTAGTTVRDDGVVEGALVEALTHVGTEPTGPAALAAIRRARGRAKWEVFREISGDQAAGRVHRRFEGSLIEAIDRGDLPPLPGAGEALGALREMGILVCLATGFSRRVLNRLLGSMGWDAVVDLSLSSEEVPRGRPHPDVVLAAARRLSIGHLGEVAVVGDTVNDLVAGTRAGASVVAGVLTGAHERRELASAPHTHLLWGIGDFPGAVAEFGREAPPHAGPG